ncbi:hypothetical protein AVEN_58335-1 [Araneus ventricosus]|uniref:Uncharacterized protein n=1 Tax=Araneus ventricosus TaxID=182803 RepID=A0A4Y2CQ16_ARAVE|nr:hypothetical protein AVEN_58335-1 [Araneus ventricosus]
MAEVEFAKHPYFSLVKDKLTPNEIDNIIRAEIPDPSSDKELHDIIVKNMIHGPCGSDNTDFPCMKDEKCTKEFPRKLQKENVLNGNGYPQYQNRSLVDEDQTVTVKFRNTDYTTVDNSWVVSYSTILTKMFNAYINVEDCSSVREIKYI